MTKDQKKEIWRWAVHNRVSDLRGMLAEIRSTMLALGGDEWAVHDKWVLAERQLRVAELEVDNLRRTIFGINYDPQ